MSGSGPAAFEPIVTEYALTPAELAAVDRALFRRTGAYRVLVALDLSILVALLVTRSPGLVALLVAQAVGLGYLFFLSGRRRWRREPGARIHRQLVVDADGVHVRTGADEGTLAWPSVLGIEHHGRCLYLFTGPKSALPIPDRALTPAQRARLAALAGRVASEP